tara:strand:+ start:393 stop:773 length:381 start_codon:yes stop_codon:yes gene_type:complete
MEKRDWKSEKIVSIDFDGVISSYDGWKGPNHLGEPINGAKEFIERIIKAGFTPVIWTTRDKNKIENWLKENEFPNIEITNNKYPSSVYIDDRCVQFKGNFKKLVTDLKKYDIYWRKKPKKIFDDLK